MLRKLGLLVLAMSMVLATGITLTTAQDDPNAKTNYQLNMRTGPGADYDVVTILEPDTPLILEGRNEENSWVLGHTTDGAQRGWLSSLHLSYQPGFSAFNLPISGEIVSAPAVAAQNAVQVPVEQPAAPVVSGTVTARTNYQMNVRTGPGTNHNPIGLAEGGAVFVLEARNGDSSWVLGHSQNNTIRGWLSAMYLTFTSGTAASLPISNEIVAGQTAAADTGTTSTVNATYLDIAMGPFDPALIEDIDLTAVPIVGRSTARASAIFREGQARGNNANVLAKVGDCSSEHWFFLSIFGWGRYNLGSYGNLQPVIDHFGESLAYEGEATHNGFNANTIGAPEWANPAMCEQGESPLQCEYRLHKPSVAIIMFGTSDLLVMTPYEFDFYMRSIVNQTVEQGIIPILSTFPGNKNFWNRTILYNQIVVRIARDYDIPLINLWLALEALPNKGLEEDGFHLGVPLTTAGDLTGANLQTGYPTRNLVTLQTLDAVWRGAMQ
jgi:uncharacterized protein YraI